MLSSNSLKCTRRNTLPRTDDDGRVPFLSDIKSTSPPAGERLSALLSPVRSCSRCFLTPSRLRQTLHQFLGFKEALEVLHLPDAGDDEDERLSDGPPEDPLVGALTGHPEPLLTIL